MFPDKATLFQETQERWPKRISVFQQPGLIPHFETDPSTVDILIEIETDIGRDDWKLFAAWSFHQAIWVVCQSAAYHSRRYVLRDWVTIEMFDQKMRSNLLGKEWIPERIIWNKLPMVRED
jgi:hypothetical protein